MSIKQIPVIIDCDPGVDDVLALMLALRTPALRVLGITTVCGNATVEYTSWNATRACLLAGRTDANVYRGAAAPLERPFLFDPEYCGKDGLCCSQLSGSPTLLHPKPAVQFLRDTLCRSPQPVTIVSIAAMTNLAEVLLRYPEVRSHIKEIVTISGYYWFNLPVARAEWNILFDPEAAEVVFSSGVPIRALGLDVTSQLKNEYAEALAAQASGPLKAFLDHSIAFIRQRGLEPGGILVDAMAVAAVLQPELAVYRRGNATVHPHCANQHLTEFIPQDGGSVLAATDFDFPAYLELLESWVNDYETCNIHQYCM